MKERDKSILNFIIDNGSAGLYEMLKLFEISRRTLYYSISNINRDIQRAGEIKRVEGKFKFIGDSTKLEEILSNEDKDFLDYQSRRNYILKKIILGEDLTIENAASFMAVSKNLVVQTLTDLKNELHHQKLSLAYEGRYLIRGDELKIRELFIHIISAEDFNGRLENNRIKEFDQRHDLQLTDPSKYQLLQVLNLLEYRISINSELEKYKFEEEAKVKSYYKDIQNLTTTNLNSKDRAFLTIYICSLSSLKPQGDPSQINRLVKKITTHFEFRANIKIKNKEQFEQILERHFLYSFNRIKYQIPVYNPLLLEIKNKYKETYNLTEAIITDTKVFPELEGIREEEIAYISTYFGYHLKKQQRDQQSKKQKVLIVGNQGSAISKALEYQIKDNFPFVDVVASVSPKEVSHYAEQCHRIISTIPMTKHDNVIVVNPILTDDDLELLMEELSRFALNTNFNIETLMDIIKENATVHDEDKLKKQIMEKLLS
ncbi:PRD domain-containing protein [Proteinivorax tanatarense]|uniref:PRD domain-containing protein n=1 Tax=Proteinivorax tanatarense TaxID=1260629 RepID=A0AAU7VP52_9FIRM